MIPDPLYNRPATELDIIIKCIGYSIPIILFIIISIIEYINKK